MIICPGIWAEEGHGGAAATPGPPLSETMVFFSRFSVCAALAGSILMSSISIQSYESMLRDLVQMNNDENMIVMWGAAASIFGLCFLTCTLEILSSG